jgi:phenylpropionate dioxygenase-like ring-hydroxylating dioxygenase large terminal subunit
MLSKENNDLITKVGPGTQMGEVLRRYWTPILLDWELPTPDCDPVRVRILGENLVAFRDTSGKVGLLANECPHRRVSLYFGRNEEGGLRCVYHGWKFDTTGQCIDMPNEPAASNFANKVKVPAYPIAETGNVIWAYLGPKDQQPPPPTFDWTTVPDTHRGISKIWQDCNWVQALEGGIDTSHSSFLHNNNMADKSELRSRSTAPLLEVENTDYGYTYSSRRHLSQEEGDYIRTYHYVMPYHQLRASQVGNAGQAVKPKASGHMWVPIDDENTMVFNYTYTWGDEPLTDPERALHNSGNELYVDIDVTNQFRSFRTRANDYLLDRDIQRTKTFTGILGTNTQDRALQETMGIIADRSQERLGTSDRAIIMARKLLAAAQVLVQDGGNPPGSQGEYYGIRPIDAILPAGTPWQDLKPRMYPATVK